MELLADLSGSSALAGLDVDPIGDQVFVASKNTSVLAAFLANVTTGGASFDPNFMSLGAATASPDDVVVVGKGGGYGLEENVFWCDRVRKTISVTSTVGGYTARDLVTDIPDVRLLAYMGGYLYFTNSVSSADMEKGVYAVDLDTDTVSTVIEMPSSSRLQGLSVDRQRGSLFLCDYLLGQLFRVNVTTTTAMAASGSEQLDIPAQYSQRPVSTAVDPKTAHVFWVTDPATGSPKLVRHALTGGRGTVDLATLDAFGLASSSGRSSKPSGFAILVDLPGVTLSGSSFEGSLHEVKGDERLWMSHATVSESDSFSYFVHLDISPTADVVLEVKEQRDVECVFLVNCTTGVDAKGVPQVYFTPMNFATPQTVTVLAQNDPVDQGQRTLTLL